MTDKPSVTVTREHRCLALEIRDDVEFGDMGTPSHELHWAETGEITGTSKASLFLLQRIAFGVAEAEQRSQSRGAGRASEGTEVKLVALMRDLCEELELSEEKEEHAPILEALNSAHNIGAQGCAARFAEAGLLKSEHLPESPAQPEEASLRRLVAAQAKVIELHQECGDNYCEFHEGKEEEFAHECQTCDSIDRLRAAKSDLSDLQGGSVFLPAAKPVESLGQWIPVSERLPPPETRVLVLGKYHGYDVSVCYLPHDRPGGWYPGGRDVGHTSHWMPLPAPPAELETEAAK